MPDESQFNIDSEEAVRATSSWLKDVDWSKAGIEQKRAAVLKLIDKFGNASDESSMRDTLKKDQSTFKFVERMFNSGATPAEIKQIAVSLRLPLEVHKLVDAFNIIRETAKSQRDEEFIATTNPNRTRS